MKAPAKSAAKPAAKSVSKSVSKPASKSKLPVKAAAKSSPKAALAPKAGKWVYTFGDGRAEGKAGMRDLLGGKGANLAEMANLGLPVPPGFTIPTSVCTYFYANDKTYPKELKAQVEKRWTRSARSRVKPLVMQRIRCWSQCAPVRVLRCPA